MGWLACGVYYGLTIQENGGELTPNLFSPNIHRRYVMKQCLNCGKEIPNINKYCSNKCQQEYQHNVYINRWLQGKESGCRGENNISSPLRKYLLKETNNKCSMCGWGEMNLYSGKIPLEIDHIDGNHKNNSPNNLRVLCPNCHSLTSTYKRLNKNGTRVQR